MLSPNIDTRRPGQYCLLFFACLILIGVCPIKTCAQAPADTVIKTLVGKLNNYNSRFTSEKIYLHFDKPYYAAGDTIWFKAYLLNAANRKASGYSNKMYIDLLNDSGKVVQSMVIPISAGLGNGDIKLSYKMRDGAYTLRAYTNWLQNFGHESFFRQRFYIGKPVTDNWLLSEQHESVNTPAGKQVKLAMQLKNTRGLPIVNEGITLRILEGRKGILKNDLQTTIEGRLNTELLLPPNTDPRKLSLLLISKQNKDKTIRLPFYPNSGDTDLQFMPEGGSMVAGLLNRIGLKAVGEDGLGVDVQGTIFNNKGDEVVSFNSLHKGMGSFMLVPQPGETYTAKVKLPGGNTQIYTLPVAQTSGIALRVDAVNDMDHIRIYVTASPDKAEQAGFTLLAMGKDTVYFGKAFSFANGSYNTLVQKAWFPGGIVNFMVLGPGNKPLNSRNVYIDHHDQLNIETVPDKPVYALNDSVTVNFNVTDKLQAPLMANFSVTVTDDKQVNNELRATNIAGNFLLTSELKGNIEDPNWYFDSKRTDAPRALDNLMLTQGWTGVSIDKALNKPIPQPAFWAESDNSVTGKLINFFGKPVVNYPVTLMSNRKGLLVIDTATNKDGYFTFRNLPFADTAAYFIKVHNLKGKEAAVGFDVREFKPAPVDKPDSTLLLPWNVNTDATLLNYFKTDQKKVEDDKLPSGLSGKLLNQVNIKANKKASLAGADGQDVYFADADVNEQELSAKGNVSLLNYLLKYVPGFHEKSVGLFTFFAMKGNWVASFVIDSIPVARFYTGVESYYEYCRSVLDNTPAAGVKNVVIYHKITPSGKNWVSYVIIRTRNNNGPILKPTPGVYIYRPLPLYVAREFYRPRYLVKNIQPDLRSTIHWQPNVVSDSSGNATFSFYAGDKPSTYTVVIEGTDMQGHFGVSTSKISIAQNAADVKKRSP